MEILGDFNTSVTKALSEIDSDYERLGGLVVCGTHTPHDVEEMIEKIKEARENGRPFLGICFGHQLAAIEYARNVLGIKDATSEEFGKGTLVVKKRPWLKVGQYDGESYWSNYKVIIDFKNPKHFITVQYHPEYQSSVDKPHPILVKFLDLCRKKGVNK